MLALIYANWIVILATRQENSAQEQGLIIESNGQLEWEARRPYR